MSNVTQEKLSSEGGHERTLYMVNDGACQDQTDGHCDVMSWLKVYGEMECSIDIGDSTITDLHCLGNSN
jgi:hypothetical protein